MLLATAVLLAAPALSQQVAAPATAPPREVGDVAAPPRGSNDVVAPPRDGGEIVAPGDAIDFEADDLAYDDKGEIVTATGTVRLARDAWKLTADRIEYNRKTGVVVATGKVISTDPEGNQAFGSRVELTDSLKDGAIDNILLVLNDGGRIAADEGQRSNQVFTLRHAVYSPCAVVDGMGCPHDPVWQVKATKLSYNRDRHRLTYRDASLEMFGIPVFFLPNFSHPDGEAKQASGMLLPLIELKQQLGLGIGVPYHFAIAPDRDITVTPHIYTAANPAVEFSARRLLRDGPIAMEAFLTYTKLVDFAPDGVTPIDRGDKVRGYFAFNGQLQHTPEWRSTFSVRLTTDDTFNRLYRLDFDDTLRSTYALERQTRNSYLSFAGWAFQSLRANDPGGQIPFVLPLVNYDWRPDTLFAGGHFQVGANSMSLFRTQGQDVQRALAFGRWDRSIYTSLGQRITGTVMLRGDLYNVSHATLATIPEYAGENGVHGRVIPLAAVDVEWPFAGPALGGTQTITPRLQLVTAPNGLNNAIPNEDSRAIDLEDINLFDLNRFPGYDRFEGGTRLTYGFDYRLDRPGWSLASQLGQSVRLAGSGDEIPQGTGFSDPASDFVGRTNLKFGSLFEITHRFRVDHNSLAVRRNEFDITIGDRLTYATIGYLKLNRNIALEDLENRSELRVGGRVGFARFWSAYGSAIIDLTTQAQNPNATGNGFKAIRHRVGVEYEDECFRIGLGWRRNYVTDRDYRAGNTFLLSIAFKTLGR